MDQLHRNTSDKKNGLNRYQKLLLTKWQFPAGLNVPRRDKSMCVLLLLHAEISKWNKKLFPIVSMWLQWTRVCSLPLCRYCVGTVTMIIIAVNCDLFDSHFTFMLVHAKACECVATTINTTRDYYVFIYFSLHFFRAFLLSLFC